MTTAQPGWYPDPENASAVRWWDGARWTNHRGPRADADAGAAAPRAVPYTAELTAPEGTRWNTVWIWLVVFLPYVTLIPFSFIDWRRMFAAETLFNPADPYGIEIMLAVFSPAMLITMALGWVIWGLTILFAYLDWRELRNREVPRPFHFAWTILYAPIYAIGRSVVVKRRTGAGSSPMWVSIVLLVLAAIWAIVITFVIIIAFAEGLGEILGPVTTVPRA